MLPPQEGFTPSTVGRVVPYPDEYLKLGPNLWLSQTGALVTRLKGPECELTPDTLEYWEETAIRGQGKPLNDLIV